MCWGVGGVHETREGGGGAGGGWGRGGQILFLNLIRRRSFLRIKKVRRIIFFFLFVCCFLCVLLFQTSGLDFDTSNLFSNDSVLDVGGHLRTGQNRFA